MVKICPTLLGPFNQFLLGKTLKTVLILLIVLNTFIYTIFYTPYTVVKINEAIIPVESHSEQLNLLVKRLKTKVRETVKSSFIRKHRRLIFMRKLEIFLNNTPLRYYWIGKLKCCLFSEKFFQTANIHVISDVKNKLLVPKQQEAEGLASRQILEGENTSDVLLPFYHDSKYFENETPDIDRWW